MNPMQILDDALNEGKAFASAAVRIRDKFKEGTAALKDIEGKAGSAVDAAIAKAKDGLAAFKAEVEKVESEAEGKSGLNPAPQPETPLSDPPAPSSPTPTEAPSGAMVTVDSAAGATVHESLDGVVTTLPHDGSEPTAISTLTGQSADVTPEAEQEARDATKAAGVEVATPAEPMPMAV